MSLPWIAREAQEKNSCCLYWQLAFQNSDCFMSYANGQHWIKCQSLLFMHQCLLWKKTWGFFFPPQTPKNSDTGKMVILFSTRKAIIYPLSYTCGWKCCFHLGEWCKPMRMGALKNKIEKEKSLYIKSVIQKKAIFRRKKFSWNASDNYCVSCITGELK